MIRLLEFIDLLLGLYTWIVIAWAIASWLVAFNVINVRSDLVRSILTFLDAVTEPVLRPIRRLLPNLGGIDVSPVILILLILLVRSVIIGNLIEEMGGSSPF